VKLLSRCIAVFLCLAISPMQLLASDLQRAGQINALIPAATRNDKPTRVKDDLIWNDLLKTEASGRVRAVLTDGSMLSLGSSSSLHVVQHDATSQQTSLEMDAGKLRSKVVKVTQPNGKFEVRTPNAVIGVVGTDFFVQYDNNRTTVICYSGMVKVTPQGGAHVQKGPSSNSDAIQVAAGQMVVIGMDVPPAGWTSQPTPVGVQRASIEDTTVNDVVPGVAATASSHVLRNLLIGVGFAGAGLGVALGTVNGSAPVQRNPQCPPGTPKC
jgi:hypothetical protein